MAIHKKRKETDKNKDMSSFKAAALSYDEKTDQSPRLTAKGRGHTALEILRIAEEKGIPIAEDSDLVELLSMVELDSEIPPELYAAVAEILSWVYRANSEM